jgi:hypothetical protein
VMTRRLMGALEAKEQAELLRLLTSVVSSNERRKAPRP